MGNNHRLINVELDPDSLAVVNPDVVHERRVAIFDLLEENYFEVDGEDKGPYKLFISVSEQKLVFDMR